MFGVRKAPTGCNFVHNDEIWKDHVLRELQTSRKWPDTWGFLTNQLTPCELPPPKTNKESTNQNDSSHLLGALDLATESRHQPKEQSPSNRGYPRTTAEEIGWQRDSIGRLERFGPHARGQTSIRRLLNWPREAVY